MRGLCFNRTMSVLSKCSTISDKEPMEDDGFILPSNITTGQELFMKNLKKSKNNTKSPPFSTGCGIRKVSEKSSLL